LHGGATMFIPESLVGKQAKITKKPTERIWNTPDQFQAILRALPDIYFQFDREGTVLDYNSAEDYELYAPPEKFLNKKVRDILPPGVAEKIHDCIREVVQTQKNRTISYSLMKRDAEHFYESYFLPLPDEQVLAIVRDITHFKVAEQALRASQERVRSQYKSFPVPTYTWQRMEHDFVMIDHNDASFELSRGMITAQIGKTMTEMFSDAPHIVEATHRAYNEKTQVKDEMDHHLRTTGEYKRLSVTYIYVPPNLVVIHTEDITERRAAEVLLRASEELNRRVLEAVPGGIAYVDKNGNIMMANLEAQRILGLNYDKITGRHVSEFETETIYEDGRPFPAEEYPVVKCLKTGVPQHRKTIGVRRPDGTISWSMFSAVPITEPKTGGVNGAVVTFIDITDRKRAEDALRKSEERYRAFLAQSSEAIWRFELEQPIDPAWPVEVQLEKCLSLAYLAECNDAMAQMYGYRHAAELIGMRLGDNLVRSDPSNMQNFSTFFRDGYRLVDGESHETDRYGKRKYFLNNIVGVLENGLLVRAWGTQRDITERKIAEENLRSERDFSTTLVQTSPAFFVAINAEGRVMMMNDAMAQALGYKPDEVSGCDYLSMFVPERDRPMLSRVFEQLIQAQGPTLNENHVLAKDGRELLVEWHGRPVMKDGKFAYFFGVGIDITERRRAEETLRAHERKLLETQKLESLGVLAGGIAHDFNNLLAAILGNVSLASMVAPADSALRPFLNSIETTTNRAAELCKQMLAYAGKGRFIVQRVDMNAVIAEMTELLKISIGRNITLKFDLASDTPAIIADATQIRQVLMNLIINASEAIGDQEGTILLSTGIVNDARAETADSFPSADPRPGKHVFVQVTDTGCGMDEDTLKKIFDPFFTTKFTGRGLGLAAVLGIVRGHEGALKVHSTPGKGTTFKMLLPCSSGVHKLAEMV
jgi:PAS domain S-box-containing protein